MANNTNNIFASTRYPTPEQRLTAACELWLTASGQNDADTVREVLDDGAESIANEMVKSGWMDGTDFTKDAAIDAMQKLIDDQSWLDD